MSYYIFGKKKQLNQIVIAGATTPMSDQIMAPEALCLHASPHRGPHTVCGILPRRLNENPSRR